MSQRIVVVTGISGVGKSWLLKKVGRRVPIQVLSAGQLISDQLTRERRQQLCYSDLRTRDITANQEALKVGFHDARDLNVETVVLDAHVVIDTPGGLQSIEPNVFASIGASLMVFLEQEPARISDNRLRDTIRNRPRRNNATLDRQQREAKKTAERIADELGTPIHKLQSDNVHGLVRLLKSEMGV